jgi:hypothetical protein
VARHVRLAHMRLSRMIAILAALAATLPGPLGAQARRELGRGDPETQLLGYYAAVMQFTPVGLPSREGRFELGGAGTLIPRISDEDRRVGFGGTKTENTNICPVYPRITASYGFGRNAIEAGFTPPVEVCGAKASVISFAIGRRMTLGQAWEGYARLSAMSGRVDVSATCDADAVADSLNLTCFEGIPSSDRVAPLGVALEFAAAWQGWRSKGIEPYFAAGIRYERIDFDVNYTRDIGKRYPDLDDHNRLRASLSRVHLAAGAAWDITGNIRLGGELYYAPGALITLRGRLAVAL